MTQRSSSLDYAAIRQHLLTQMGIGVWVDKNSQPKSLPQSLLSQLYRTTPTGDTEVVVSGTQDGLSDNLSSGLATKKFPQENQSHQQNNQATKLEYADIKVEADLPSQETSEQYAVLTTATSHNTQPLPSYLQQVVVKVATFELFGIRYREWLLLCDAKRLDTKTLGVWQSLERALKNNDSRTLALQARYPLVFNDYPAYQHYEQGRSVLLGFLLRLCPNPPQKIVFLTTMPDGIELGQLSAQPTFIASLDEMWQNADAKKSFWHLLHHSI